MSRAVPMDKAWRLAHLSAEAINANGMSGATLHPLDSDAIKPLRDIEVVWGHKGNICALPWDEFRLLVAKALDA